MFFLAMQHPNLTMLLGFLILFISVLALVKVCLDLRKKYKEVMSSTKKDPVVNQIEKRVKEDFEEWLYKDKKPDDKSYSEQLIDQGDAYTAKTHLMTPTEREFYKVLEKVYGDDCYVFCQVRVVDVIQPNVKKYTKNSREYMSLFRQLSQWHFDYVVCARNGFRVICAIELDDGSHKRKDRVRRDEVLDKVCSRSGLDIKRVRIW
ncbi:DUF2726 domain-containing protein [Chromohalobacter japonicus]|uniref:DUF2726 domain-containing protein n=1 Tax=Chromohalobacter japonicus TaxID=223900 RepID=UPI001FF1823C|nr:DUF2726 domain-containing protein [Chromohalobacter japonicus]MCK0753468.1 DUF2726 domain-containing protein [Chromohalobacter japonicus]